MGRAMSNLHNFAALSLSPARCASQMLFECVSPIYTQDRRSEMRVSLQQRRSRGSNQSGWRDRLWGQLNRVVFLVASLHSPHHRRSNAYGTGELARAAAVTFMN